MQNFKEILESLDSVEALEKIELFNDDGKAAGTIDNKPGTQGSLKVYFHLYNLFNSISIEAAKEGVSLFSEHSEDATDNPGKHPNIDRLLEIIEHKKPLSMKVTLA